MRNGAMMKLNTNFFLSLIGLSCVLLFGQARGALPNDMDITVANINLLHGFSCDDPPAPAASANQCRLADRVELLFQWLIVSGCPDIVTLQEIVDEKFVLNGLSQQPLIGPLDSAVELIEAQLGVAETACGFRYDMVFDKAQGIDDELILTRYPVLTRARFNLHSVFQSPQLIRQAEFDRHVLYARVDHPFGPLDVFTTHLSSSEDFGSSSCDISMSIIPGVPVSRPCPDECSAAGAMTVQECQAVQLAQHVATLHDVTTPAVITGDINAEPGTFEYLQFTNRGYVDVYLEAGNPECDPTTGIGCTSGREDRIEALESPATLGDTRVDFIFLVPPAAEGPTCSIDPPSDEDNDSAATRTFADAPNPFAVCGGPNNAICWVSDHEGVELDLNCALQL
jgi:endonuclease/exonuclease/phosphatase family metal-dependent hydrolase